MALTILKYWIKFELHGNFALKFSVYKTHIKKIQVKQNHTVRLIFFARTFGRKAESAKPLLNLLDFLTVDNIYRLEVLNSRIHCIMVFSLKYLTTHFNMPEIFIDITPDIQLLFSKIVIPQGAPIFISSVQESRDPCESQSCKHFVYICHTA